MGIGEATLFSSYCFFSFFLVSFLSFFLLGSVFFREEDRRIGKGEKRKGIKCLGLGIQPLGGGMIRISAGYYGFGGRKVVKK